jgi:hypothetical protein
MNQQQLDQWIQAAQECEDDFSVLKRYQQATGLSLAGASVGECLLDSAPGM